MQGMGSFEWSGAEAFVAATALVLSILSFSITIVLDLLTRRREARIENRDDRVERSSAYLQLEVQSSEVFKYEAEHAVAIDHLRQRVDPGIYPPNDLQARALAKNFYFQSLNLFEVCSKFRREGVIYPDVYASWVAWFWDIAGDWYFRSIWISELRQNYTREVRDIFDLAYQILATDRPGLDTEREFYRAVSRLVALDVIALEETQGDIIADWPDQIAKWQTWDFSTRTLGRREPVASVAAPAPAAPVAPPATQPSELTFSWDRGRAANRAAAFAARAIGAQQSYVSHGEIQTGLSTDGLTWIADLEGRLREDFADPGKNREMLIVRDADRRIVGIGIIAWELDGPARFGTIEDMAVDPDLRGGGIGRLILERLVARLTHRGCDWAFLESGRENTRAHAFFQAHEFREISHVFVRKLA